MTVRPLPRSRLRQLVPPLVDSQALIALVPATGDLRWAAQAAWDVARAAAQGDRRVALVDLWIEDPKLHEVVGLAPDEGIVDAFEYGVSLTKAAHQVGGVHFIPAGTYTASAGELFGHPRWAKLQAGFRVEGALLLLYLSAGGLARLSATPDGVVVLSPEGFELESPIGQGIAAALERGTTLLGVVRERWTPAPAPALDLKAPPSRDRRAARRARPAVVAVTLVVGAVGGWALLARRADQPAVVPAAHRSQGSVVAMSRPAPAEPSADSLAWTVQLAAYGTLEKALADADRLAAADLDAFVTPLVVEVKRSGGGTVWYRVLAGAYPTRDAAAAARGEFWRRGRAPRGEGHLLRAPYSFEIVAPEAGDLDGLRRRGIPAVRGRATGRLLVGAFETPEQAGLTEAQIKRAGVRATLIARVGTP